MKGFLHRVLKFFLPVVVLLIILYLTISLYIRHQMKQHRFPVSVTSLAMGDSHIQTAICDSIYPGLRNLAQSNEAYVYTYYKIKYLTHSNPQIDTIFLGAAPHNFSAYYEIYLTEPDLSANYFWILPPLEQLDILCRMKAPFTYLMDNIWREISHGCKPGKDTLWLGNWHPVITPLDTLDPHYPGRIRSQFYRDEELYPFSRVNQYWMDQIVMYCKQNRIQLILLSTPVYQAYARLIPETYQQLMTRMAQ